MPPIVARGRKMLTKIRQTTQITKPLDAKILEHLGDRVILKPLTRWNEAYKEFPRYVMEYLVSRYVEPGNPVAGQHKIDKILKISGLRQAGILAQIIGPVDVVNQIGTGGLAVIYRELAHVIFTNSIQALPV